MTVKRRGKSIAISTAVIGVVVLVAAGIVSKDRIIEDWYIWRLEKGSEEAQVAAVERLGNMKSVRAMLALARAFQLKYHQPDSRSQRLLMGHCLKAFAMIGEPAARALVGWWRRTTDDSVAEDEALALALWAIGTDAVPAITEALQDENDTVRVRAAAVLSRVRGDGLRG